MTGPIHGIDEQNVWPAIGIVVEEGTAGTKRFGEQLAAIGAAIVLKMDTGLRSDIRELKAQRACGQRKRKAGRKNSKTKRIFQEFPALHGRFTRPLRMA